MEDNTYTDRVITVHEEHRDEAALRLEDHTPHGGYTALVEAADEAGVDLTDVSDGQTVGRATLTPDGDVIAFTTETECDHTDGERLGTHPEAPNTGAILYNDDPKAGLKQTTRCMECGETVHVFYRIEEIEESDGETVWERE